jgi:hypothetical protein
MNRSKETLAIASLILTAALVPRTAHAQSSCGTYLAHV